MSNVKNRYGYCLNVCESNKDGCVFRFFFMQKMLIFCLVGKEFENYVLSGKIHSIIETSEQRKRKKHQFTPRASSSLRTKTHSASAKRFGHGQLRWTHHENQVQIFGKHSQKKQESEQGQGPFGRYWGEPHLLWIPKRVFATRSFRKGNVCHWVRFDAPEQMWSWSHDLFIRKQHCILMMTN